MLTRANFDQQLEELKEQLLQMAETAKKSVELSMDALIIQDVETAEKIIGDDVHINRMEEFINEKAIALIAKEAPVAVDLRKIIVALKISYEIERIGDMAVNIAKSTIQIGCDRSVIPFDKIEMMMTLTLNMYTYALNAYLNEDAELAKECARQDDVVDDMYDEFVRDLLCKIPGNEIRMNEITQLVFIFRFTERIADHVTNIAEHVVYLVTAKHCDLNTNEQLRL